MNENEEPMMMMASHPHNGNGFVGSATYFPQAFSTNVQYLPDTLSKPVNTPFIRDASQRHSRNYNFPQNSNQGRLISNRTEGTIADHYFNYHQNPPHQMVSVQCQAYNIFFLYHLILCKILKFDIG